MMFKSISKYAVDLLSKHSSDPRNRAILIGVVFISKIVLS